MVYSSMKANLNFRKQIKYLADDHWIIEYDSYKTWTLDHKFLFVTQECNICAEKRNPKLVYLLILGSD